MTTSLHFSSLIQLLYEMDNLGIPQKWLMRHRGEYEYILSTIQLADHHKVEVNMNTLLYCAILGSQPTVSKRVNELEDFKLIRSEKNDDLRIRTLKLTNLGEEYLERCSTILQSICQVCEARSE